MSAVAERVHTLVKEPGRWPTPTEYINLTTSILEHYKLPVEVYEPNIEAYKSHFVRSLGYWYTRSRVELADEVSKQVPDTGSSEVDIAIQQGKGAIEIRNLLTSTFPTRRKMIKDSGKAVGVDQIIARHQFFITSDWVRYRLLTLSFVLLHCSRRVLRKHCSF